jgi:hypothetical protein
MENKSPTTGTFAFGTKHFQDLTLLKSMLDILMKPLPTHEFVKEAGQEAPDLYSIAILVLIVLIKK